MGITMRLTRRRFHSLGLATAACALSPKVLTAALPTSFTFIHPGLLHGSEDILRLREAVRSRRQPIFVGFEQLRSHRFSQPDYRMHEPGAEIGRNPSVNFEAFDADSNAAYQCALMAAITDDRAFQTISRRIVLGWSASLERVSGADAVLMAGLGPFKLINAAELLRANRQLNSEEVSACQRMFRRALLPTLIDFAPFANGNWDTAAIKTMLAISVFCDDQILFERALSYYTHGTGDGRLEHYIYGNGECQESGRDQQHTQLGLGHMADACEIAWHQGLDLYGVHGNRLLKGFEYTAGYNLGETVEFVPDVDRTGKYRHRFISSRGPFRPIYEQVLAHFQTRRNLPAPCTSKVVQEIRPEGAAPGADHTGFGTLLYAGQNADWNEPLHPTPAAALRTGARASGIVVDWIPVRNAHDYDIERADDSASFHKIASKITDNFYVDSQVRPGARYVYRVAANLGRYESVPSLPSIIYSSLPSPWRSCSIGSPSLAGGAQFDGETLQLTSAGSHPLGSGDQAEFAFIPASTEVSLSARFLPQVASQAASFGIVYRTSLTEGAPAVALLVRPDSSGDRERPGWGVSLMLREVPLEAPREIAFHRLENPIAALGRLVGRLWLLLQRKDALVTAKLSLDGKTWISVGDVVVADQAAGVIGLAASSGISDVLTDVRFDSISIGHH